LVAKLKEQVIECRTMVWLQQHILEISRGLIQTWWRMGGESIMQDFGGAAKQR